MKRVDPATGTVYEFKGGQWQIVQEAAPAAQAGAGEAAPLLEGSWLGRQGQAALVGAGDVFSTVGRNVRDVYAGLRGDVDAQAAIAGERMEADDIRARLRAEAPAGALVGAALPSLAAAPLAGASVLGNVALGAATGALGSESGQFGIDAATGGALSLGTQLAARTVSRVSQARQAIAAQRAQAAQQAAQAGELTTGGIDGVVQRLQQTAPEFVEQLTPAQRAINPAARRIEETFGNNPFLSGPMMRIEAQQAGALNRAVGKALGAGDDVGVLTPELVGQVHDQIGRRFAAVADVIGEVPETAGKGLVQRMRVIADDEAVSLTGGAFEGIAAKAEKAIERGPLTGAQLMNWRSQLVDRIKDLSGPGASPDSALRNSLWEAVESIDDAIGKAAPSGDVKVAYKVAREQWKLLRSAEQALTNDGNVSAVKFANALKKADPVGYARGQNQSSLYDMTRFLASSIGAPVVGRGSPTATRMAVNEAISNPSLLGAVGIAGRSLGGRAAMGLYQRVGAGNVAAWNAYTRAMEQSAATEAAKRIGGASGVAAAGIF
jgi:hypothetical protein